MPRVDLISRPVRVVMECGDDLTFINAPPGVGDIIWCCRCDTGRVVVSKKTLEQSRESRSQHRKYLRRKARKKDVA